MKTREQLEKIYVGKLIKNAPGGIDRIHTIDYLSGYPLIGHKGNYAPHLVTVLKPKKRELTDEQKQEMADKFYIAYRKHHPFHSSTMSNYIDNVLEEMGLPRPRGK